MTDLRTGRHLGLTGLATMGQNLARNIARRGFPLAVHNRTYAKTEQFLGEHGGEGDLAGATSAAELVAALERPRAILMMVKAGAPVDAVIDELRPHLDEGDLLIDGGNSWWADTDRRLRSLEPAGIRYLGLGVSGGEEGALHGPSLMPGGTRAAYEQVEEVLTSIAARYDGEPCCAYLGDGGAGHYVKMVHNGIEYADMQLIAESYDLLRTGLGMGNDELAGVFDTWNSGDLDSFLIAITAQILRRREGDGHLVDLVLDRAEQKGTGRLTSQSALDLGAPVTAITEAVFARAVSALKEERVAASSVLPGPVPGPLSDVEAAGRDAFVGDVRAALYASKLVAYAQGFDQLRRASTEFGFALRLPEVARIWRAGCIIRARFLDRITAAYDETPDLLNLLLASYFISALTEGQDAWRRVVAIGARSGIPLPAFASALSYYDSYRRERLPANLIQAQRDLFGAHTYERVDRPGPFHSDWVTR